MRALLSRLYLAYKCQCFHLLFVFLVISLAVNQKFFFICSCSVSIIPSVHVVYMLLSSGESTSAVCFICSVEYWLTLCCLSFRRLPFFVCLSFRLICYSFHFNIYRPSSFAIDSSLSKYFSVFYSWSISSAHVMMQHLPCLMQQVLNPPMRLFCTALLCEFMVKFLFCFALQILCYIPFMGIMAYVLNDSDPEEVAIARVVEEAIGACLCL